MLVPHFRVVFLPLFFHIFSLFLLCRFFFFGRDFYYCFFNFSFNSVLLQQRIPFPANRFFCIPYPRPLTTDLSFGFTLVTRGWILASAPLPFPSPPSNQTHAWRRRVQQDRGISDIDPVGLTCVVPRSNLAFGSNMAHIHTQSSSSSIITIITISGSVHTSINSLRSLRH